MTKRNRPVRHGVKSYTKKNGAAVKSHQRGSGTKSKRPRKAVGTVVQKGSVLGDLNTHELVLAKDRGTAWWRPDADTIVYWRREWEIKDDEDVWVWDGPYVLKGYEKETMDGRRLGSFTDSDAVERKLSRFRF